MIDASGAAVCCAGNVECLTEQLANLEAFSSELSRTLQELQEEHSKVGGHVISAPLQLPACALRAPRPNSCRRPGQPPESQQVSTPFC